MVELLSVIVPVYNVEVFLNRCLDSLVKQIYKNYEVIMVDDGSTDKSGIICDEYAGKYEQFKVIHRKNGGLSAARNTGMEAARGKYILFLDSDDYLEKETLVKVHEVMEDGQYDIGSFAARRIDEQEKYLYELRFDEMTGSRIFNNESREVFLWKDFLQYKVGWEVCFHVFKRDLIEKYDIRFDESVKFAEDLPFTFEYMLHVNRWVKMSDVLYNYTLRGTSLTGKTDKTVMIKGIMYYDFLKMKEKLEKQYGKSINKSALLYASLMYYFYPRFKTGIGMKGFRNIIMKSDISKVQRRQLLSLLFKKKALEKLFGELEGAKLYQLIKYMWHGSVCAYTKGCRRIEENMQKKEERKLRVRK